MKVSEVMTTDIQVCLPSEHLDRAAQIMWDGDCGCVPVIDGDAHPVGVLTDRDVCMAAYSSGGNLRDLDVQRAMSGHVYTCKQDDPVETAHGIMRQHQVRRLPVVDNEDKLVGLVSLSDFAQVRSAGGNEARKKNRWAGDVLDTLRAITQPRKKAQAVQPKALLS